MFDCREEGKKVGVKRCSSCIHHTLTGNFSGRSANYTSIVTSILLCLPFLPQLTANHFVVDYLPNMIQGQNQESSIGEGGGLYLGIAESMVQDGPQNVVIRELEHNLILSYQKY